MRILVLGGSGQLGTQLRTLALPQGVQLLAPTRTAVDLGDPAAIRRLIATEPWSVVIDAAGYSNVDRAESEDHLAFAINAQAAAYLAEETGKRGIPLIYVSTDYVFDGGKGAPYTETDAAAPLNAYGRSKLAGERHVSAANYRHVILRTAWLYSPYGTNFVRTILRLAQERERLPVVADQLGCPTSARELAKACLDIALFCAAKPDQENYGVYHFAGAGAATWFEFASAILRRRPAGSPDCLSSCRYRVPNIQARHPDQPTAGLTARQSSMLSDWQRDLGVVHWRTRWSAFSRAGAAHEGHHTRERVRHPALPGNAGYQKTTDAGLR
jgi:dTDP-4-dehydrorhamnose reductase